MNFSREVPVKKKVDVCVVGGGPAGVAAAVAAARLGAKVFLAEALGCLGGLGTAGGVPCFMMFADRVNFYADGFGRELLQRLNKEVNYGYDGRCINTERLKRLYDDMCLESGVEISFFADFVGAESDGGIIKSAVFNAKSGLFAVEAAVFVDCTGDGDLSARAGAEFMYGDPNGDVMPSTLCSHWAGIDWKKFYGSGTVVQERLLKAFGAGVFRNNDPHHTGINPSGAALGGGNMGHLFGLKPLDESSLTAGMVEGRRQSVEFENFYRNYVPGFENAELSFTAAIVGVRASRRIVGDYVLGIEDYRARRVFDDEVGRYCYPIDVHPASPAAADQEAFRHLIQDLHYNDGESYGIPYRALTVKGFRNLLVAGRCVSADTYMEASIRVMPGCYITGQAAGVAARLALETGDVRGFAIGELQAALASAGAFLPNRG